MAIREMVKIDEEKCDGCGLCVPSCAEGAIQIIDGKARLVADNLCDGLGACLGECPQGAISIEKREADEFEEQAVAERLKQIGRPAMSHAVPHDPDVKSGGCPSTRVQSFGGCPSAQLKTVAPPSNPAADLSGRRPSELRQWPVQLHLVPPSAPFLRDADVLIAADCVPFAYADFHKDLLKDKALLIACPKLDDGQAYIEKLSRMFSESGIKSLTVAIMEVPCCSGLVAIVRQALAKSGADLPLNIATFGIAGQLK
jgi:NAD-dependent dihydropyrimidine dehydrogenase PreA subunit